MLSVKRCMKCISGTNDVLSILCPTMNNSVKNFSAEQKLLLALRLYYSAFELKIGALKKFHPEMTENEILLKVKTIFSHARS